MPTRPPRSDPAAIRPEAPALTAVRIWQALLVILVVLGLAWADRVYLDGAVLLWLGRKLFDWTNWIAFWR